MRQVYDYISKDSVQNATNKVLNDVIAAMDKAVAIQKYMHRINTNSIMTGLIEYLKNMKYRIVYRFNKNVIRVLRVRHTKREPKIY